MPASNFGSSERYPGSDANPRRLWVSSSAGAAGGGLPGARGSGRTTLDRAGFALLEKSGEATLLATADGTLRFANRAAYSVFGYDARDIATPLSGRNWLAWVHPADEEALLANIENLRRRPESHTLLETRLRHKGGEWRWFEITLTNLLDDPEIGAWLLQARDVTPRHEADAKLRHVETLFHEAQRLASLGSWEWEVETGSLICSEELFHILGLQPGETELTYEQWLGRIHEDDRQRARQSAQRSLLERKSLDITYRIVRPSGATRTVHVRGRVQIDAGGRIVGLSGIAQDVTEDVQAAQELRESEARFRRIADSNIIGIVSWDVRGRITEANDAFLRIAGYTRSDLWEGRLHWDELTPPEYREADARAWQELAERGSCAPYEKEYIRKDGSRVPILIGVAYLDPGAGNDQGICFVLDMSERRRVETALRDSERRYRHLVESSPDAIFVHARGEILFANESSAALLGINSPQMLIGQRVLDVVHPELRDKARARLEHWATGHTDESMARSRLVRFDGGTVEVEIASTPVVFEGRSAVQSLVRDVTERLLAHEKQQERLRRSEEQFRTLIENVSDGISILGADGSVIYQSPALEQMTGYPAEQFSQGQVFDVLHPDDRERARRALEEVEANPGEALTVEYRLRHRDGSWRILESICRVLPPDAPFTGVLVTTRDTTWRREVENRLRQVSNELQAIYDAFPDIYLRLDANGVILAYHAADISRFLLPPEQFFGRRVQDVLPPQAARIVADALAQIAKTGRAVRIEYELPLPDGPRRYEARLQPLSGGQIVAIVRDLPGTGTGIIPEPSSGDTPVEPQWAGLETVKLCNALETVLPRVAAQAQARNVRLVEGASCVLDALSHREDFAMALHRMLEDAIAASVPGGTLHLGCEARLSEISDEHGIRLRGRVRLHITGQGALPAGAEGTTLANTLLQPHDGAAGVETAAHSFVFWLDLRAAKIV